jgi:ribosome-associated protein
MNSTAEQPSSEMMDTSETMNASETTSASETTGASETTDPSSEAAPLSRFMQVAVGAALNRKAEDVLVLDLSKVSDFTELFLVCSGTNERQAKAIADNVRDELRMNGLKPLHVEGENKGQWVLMDYGGEMVIHVFVEETRQFYALERLWADAPVVTSQYLKEE